MSTKLKLLGVDVASIGDAHAETSGAIVYSYQNGELEVYKRIVVSEDKKYLLGTVLVGDASSYNILLQYYLNGIELPEYPDTLILPDRSNESLNLGIDALPATAIVCPCYNLSKGSICNAIAAGCTTVDELKVETRAATGCGSCVSLLESILDSELADEVNTDLCEHFV